MYLSANVSLIIKFNYFLFYFSFSFSFHCFYFEFLFWFEQSLIFLFKIFQLFQAYSFNNIVFIVCIKMQILWIRSFVYNVFPCLSLIPHNEADIFYSITFLEKFSYLIDASNFLDELNLLILILLRFFSCDFILHIC